MTPPRTSHPWAIVEAGRVRWHVPGSFPPEYAVNDELEALWEAGQKRREYKQIVMWEILDLAHQEAELCLTAMV